MSSPFQRNNDPLAQILGRITELERTVRESVSSPFRIPTLAEDPSEEDATNIWMLPDGRIRARHRNTADTAWVYREWVSSAPGSGSSGTAPAPPAAAPITNTLTAVATYTQSYRSTGAARTDNGATHLYYGSSGDGFNGRNQSLVGFDHAAIAATLTGSTINSVQLGLTNVHAWYHSGVDIYFGIHNFGSEPATWSGGGIPRSKIVKHHFGKPQRRTVSMPLEFAQAFRDGWGKGIALEAPSTSREFYGYAAGIGSGQALPVLTINYTK